MNNKRTTKRTLALSLLVMLMCVAMLVGTTFAWFTDSASTAVNKIQAGTLDVQLLDAAGNSLENQTLTWQKVAGHERDEVLWEPGCTYNTQQFYIKNNGNLNLKFKFSVSGIMGDAKLLEALDFTAMADASWFKFNTGAVSIATDGEFDLLKGYDVDTLFYGTMHFDEYVLEPGEKVGPIVISGHMKETAGNEYQNLSIDGIAITLVATQATGEEDSYNGVYDEDAEYAIPVATADELAAALANGQDVILTAPVQMPDVIEVTGDVTIYGSEDGQLLVPDNADRVINITENTEPVTLTLSNVDVVGPTSGTYTRGVSVYGNSDVTIVADNSSVSANYYALNIASANDNVQATIRNTTLTGWCAFQTWSAGTKATFENCTLIGNNDKTFNADGWNDFATIVINTDAPNTELTFTNCRIEANQTTGNNQYFFSIRAAGAKIALDGCTFFADGVELADNELSQYISVYNPEALNFEMTIDGREISVDEVTLG